MDSSTFQMLIDRRPPYLSEEAAANMLRELIVLMLLDHDSDTPQRLRQEQIDELLGTLRNLTEEEIVSLGHPDSLCPICIVPFRALLVEEEMAHAMDSPARPVDDLGVTRLQATCGHLFCRKDISRWIREGHDSCPLCRRSLTDADSSAAEASDTLIGQQQLEERFYALVQRHLPSVSEERREYAGMYA